MKTNSPHIVCFDAYNFIHRANSGFTQGEWPIVFNFFRSFRAEVERHKPSRIIVVTEGVPRRQLIASGGSYKANRVQEIEVNSEEHDKALAFERQKSMILRLLSERFPVSVMRHPDYEADDVIYNLVKNSTTAVPWTLLSTDTDFIQMLNEFPNFKLYNPVKKKYIEEPDYDYTLWKALRGDKTDNISGLPGIGDKTAEKLALSPSLFEKRIMQDEARFAQWKLNYGMIKLHTFDEKQTNEVTSSKPYRRWDSVNAAFASMGFQSMLKEKTWKKFVDTFDQLFGE